MEPDQYTYKPSFVNVALFGKFKLLTKNSTLKVPGWVPLKKYKYQYQNHVCVRIYIIFIYKVLKT